MTAPKTIKRLAIHATRVRVADVDGVVYGATVSTSTDVARIATSLLAHEDQEVLLVFLLDARMRVQGYTEVARGGMTDCVTLPRDIFRSALMAGAVSVILAHNHPSGDARASEADFEMTARACAAGDLLGVSVLDHVVVAQGGGHYSMLDAGAMPRRAVD